MNDSTHFSNMRLGPVCRFFLFVVAFALPWELFQRLPGGIDGTLNKAAGGAVILCAVFAFAKRPVISSFRTGLEAPLALFAIACVISLPGSADPAASYALLTQYVLYALLFYAIVSLTLSLDDATVLAKAFVFAAIGVALLAIGCSLGWLFPSVLAKSGWVHERLTAEMASGAMMRLAPVSEDINQGAFILLIAFSLSLFLFDYSRRALVHRCALYAANAALFAGVVITLSRSVIAVACVVVLVRLVRPPAGAKRPWVVAAGVLVVAVAAALLNIEYIQGIVRRLQSGITIRNPSYEVRLAGLSAFRSVFPKYWLSGTGLGASDAILHASPSGTAMHGTTLHSVPLKMALETGVLGAIAYIWLCVAFVQRFWRTAHAAVSPVQKQVAVALCACLFSVFAITLVQPFVALPYYPFFAALGIVTTRKSQSNDDTSGLLTGSLPIQRRPQTAAAFATVVVGVVVVFNIQVYQRVARETLRFADALEAAVVFEERGDWANALDAYAVARTRAKSYLTDVPSGRLRHESSFADLAGGVADLGFVYRRMGIGTEFTDRPTIADYGTGRIQLAQGNPEASLAMFPTKTTIRRGAFETDFARGEALWALGRFTEALEHYAAAAALRYRSTDSGHREQLMREDDRLAELSAMSVGSTAAMLEMASIYRRRGLWYLTVRMAQRVVAVDALNAEAMYLLGIDAEVRADPVEAADFYRAAVRTSPDHRAAALRLLELIEP